MLTISVKSYNKILFVLLILSTNQQLNCQEIENGGDLEKLIDSVFGSTTTAATVIVNNSPKSPTIVPFIPQATTPTPEFLNCFERCPTTSEYDPVCGSNRQEYRNEAKFNCAKSCGLDIQIVRRGSCRGLLSSG